jgi:hypothetical protein
VHNIVLLSKNMHLGLSTGRILHVTNLTVGTSGCIPTLTRVSRRINIMVALKNPQFLFCPVIRIRAFRQLPSLTPPDFEICCL